MREVIIEKLKQIEQQGNITILPRLNPAAVRGALNHRTAIFDVRFIYVRPKIII